MHFYRFGRFVYFALALVHSTSLLVPNLDQSICENHTWQRMEICPNPPHQTLKTIKKRGRGLGGQNATLQELRGGLGGRDEEDFMSWKILSANSVSLAESEGDLRQWSRDQNGKCGVPTRNLILRSQQNAMAPWCHVKTNINGSIDPNDLNKWPTESIWTKAGSGSTTM